MLQALIQSGFVITASWPIHTEMRTRLRARSSAALASSIYLVCRKLPQKKIGYFREIQQKIDTQIQTDLRRFWKDGIRGGDFFISAIGPAMKILSQYRRIERYSGDEISFKEQLDYIRSITTSFLVSNLLESQETVSIDNISLFYLAFRWTFQDISVDFVEAQKLCQACGVEIESGIKLGLILKQGSKVAVLDAYRRNIINSKNLELVNLMHEAILAWKEGDKQKLDDIFSSSNSYIDSTFWLFCQAVSECLPKNNPEKKSLEGLLVSKYST
jgi:adenine-specific DNA methylase